MANGLQGVGKSAASGAALGSFIPGIGTGIGAVAGGLFGLGKNIFQGLTGLKQKREAEALDPQRPEFQIPEAQLQQLGLYRGLAQQARLPGQAQMEDQLNLAASSGQGALARAAGSAQDVIAGASNIAGGQARSLNQLTIEGSRQQRQSQELFGRGLGSMAQSQERQFNLNQMIPFLNEVERKQALEGAGLANISGALGDTSNLAFETANFLQQRQGL